ncbi:hypothetical protein D3C81_1504370 [compost metagenome]
MVALALPMLHVQVSQFNQWRLGRHEADTAGVEGHPRDRVKAVGALIVLLPGASSCGLLSTYSLGRPAIGSPRTRLQHANLLDALGAELAIFLLDHLDVADHGQHAALGSPTQHLLRPYHHHIGAHTSGLLVCLGLQLARWRVIDEGMAQAMAQPLGEEPDRPGVEVIAGVVDVLSHLDNGLWHIVAHLQRLSEHAGGHVAHGLGVRRQQG